MNYNNKYSNIENNEIPMKKILIGICGIGNGHVNRQKAIIDNMVKYNVKIVIATTKKYFDFFNNTYPDIKIVIVDIPWIVCNNNGIDFKSTEKTYLNNKVNQFESFLKFSIEVTSAFGEEYPDIIFTDYEPNVAQYAYAINRPLICLEQQSKFLALDFENINEYSINEEKSRLLYFFPKAEKRYVSSFSPIEEDNKYNIEVLPPIILKSKKKKVIENKVVVYFSPYSSDSVQYSKILDLIKNYKEYKFYIYTDLDFKNYKKYNNLIFKSIDNKFKDDLCNCLFIISTSGHQLISEAIDLDLPMYIFPLDTFEQNYNCFIVEKYSLGKKISNFDSEEFNEFLNAIEEYKINIKIYKERYWKEDWESVLFSKLERDFNIQKLNKNIT